jgi:hypothetical protein
VALTGRSVRQAAMPSLLLPNADMEHWERVRAALNGPA